MGKKARNYCKWETINTLKWECEYLWDYDTNVFLDIIDISSDSEEDDGFIHAAANLPS